MTEIFNEIMNYPVMQTLGDLDKPAKYEKFFSQGKDIHLIYGLHGSQQAMELIRDNIESKLENPGEWLFLIEGAEAKARYGISRDEASYACLLAKKKGIKIEDPVIAPTEKEVIEKAIEEGVPQGLVYASIMYIMLSQGFNQMMVYMSRKYGINQLSLLDLYGRIAAISPEKREEVFENGFDKLSKLSTKVSTKKLEKLITNNKDRSKLLIYIGEAHLEMVEGLKGN